MTSSPDHLDFAITSLFCGSNLIILIMQFVNLNKERKMFEGKERLGFATRSNLASSINDLDSEGQQEELVLSRISSASLVKLVASELKSDDDFLERDRQRVLKAWSSSKYRASFEISDRKYDSETERDGSQQPDI